MNQPFGGLSHDLIHHSLHALGSRMYGFVQELGPDDSSSTPTDPAEVASHKEADRTTYVVRIRHLPSRAEAQALANQLKGRFGISEPKVSG